MPAVLAFAGVSAIVIMTPGPDTAMTISGTLSGGRRGGVLTALGVSCGQAAWTLAASAGVSALLIASAPAFLAVKYAGAAYLTFLGAQALRAAAGRRRSRAAGALGRADVPGGAERAGPAGGEERGSAAGPAGAAGAPRRRSGAACFRRGLLSNLSNPKMAVFFTVLLPQFGSRFAGLALLGLAFCAMTLGWLCCYALAVARLSGLLLRPPVRRALDAVTGAVLVTFGVRLAAERG